MDRIKIGIAQEYAIIIKRKTNSGTTYEAEKVLAGHYIPEDKIFIDDDENCYLHFSEYTPTIKDDRYFISHIEVPDYLEELIANNTREFADRFLEKFKNYFFQCRSEGVICIDKATEKKYEYYDDLIIFEHQLESELAEQLTEIVEGVANQLNEKLAEEMSKSVEKENETYNIELNKTPYEIVSETQEYVKGQDKAIVSIVTNLYQYLKFENGAKNNMLVVGPTGVGKTFIFEILAKILDLPLLIYSVPGLTQSGYVGKSVDDILVQLITSCNGNIKKAEKSIIILDEIDKIASNADSNSKIGDESVQNELLKIIEGDKRLVSIGQGMEKEDVEFDTSNIIFVGTGAFQKIFDEKPKKSLGFGAETQPTKVIPKLNGETITKYGIKPELIGRMPIIVQLRNLEEHDLCDIIMNSKGSGLRKVERLITEECGLQITNLNDIVHKIARDAISRKVGARGINATIAELMGNIYYELFNHPGEYAELTFGENILKDSTDFALTKKVKGKVRKLVPKQETE